MENLGSMADSRYTGFCKITNCDVVVVRIFNATRHPRHIEAAVIVVYMYLYSLAFMDHPCTLGAAVSPSAALSTLYSTQGMSSMS